MKDITLACRQLLKRPGLSLVAVLTLALGIGSTTALFSVVYGVLMNPYPYASPGTIWAPGVRSATVVQRMRPYRLSEVDAMRRLPAFATVMATAPGGALLTGEFAPESLSAIRVTADAFNFLGVAPVLGRTLQPSDVTPEGVAQPVVVLSFARWQRLFGGDPAAVGKTLLLDDVRHTIVGVMPSRFGWWTSDGVWLPLGRDAVPDPMVFPIARLREGTPAAVAEQQLHALQVQLAAGNPPGFPKGAFASTLTNYLDITAASGTMQTSLQLLFGAVVFLLLIACANVANLQLARVSSRAREMALRLALGAGRRQIVRQLLTESVLVAGIGGLAGLAFAYGITQLMVSLMPPYIVPNEARIAIDLRALAFCVGVSVVTGVVFGLLPAVQASRTDLTQVLNDEARGSGGVSGTRLRSALVVAEVAISVILLGGAAVTLRSLNALTEQELGFEPAQVTLMQLPLAAKTYGTATARNQFAQELLTRVRRLPQVEAATIGVGGLPFGGPPSPYAIPGVSPAEDRRVRLHLVDEDYLRVLRVPLRRGRMLSDRDVTAADHVAVINEATAALWPAGVDPLGQRLTLDALVPPARSSALVPGTPSKDVTIIGIVASARNDGLRAEPQPAVLLPYTLIAPLQRTLAIRTTGDPALVVNDIRAQLRALDPQQPISSPLSLDEIVQAQTAQPRFLVALFGLFAGLGVALAVAGLYSVLSHLVARRTREIGIRMALGARPSDVLRLVGTAGGRLVSAGLIVGLAGAIATSHLIIRRLQLFGVRADDPLTYLAIGSALLMVATCACLVPAWQAARVPPTDAMR